MIRFSFWQEQINPVVFLNDLELMEQIGFNDTEENWINEAAMWYPTSLSLNMKKSPNATTQLLTSTIRS